jgi:catalase
LVARVDDREPERRKTVFDPIPRVDGIDTSDNPLSEVRADLYTASAADDDGRRPSTKH